MKYVVPENVGNELRVLPPDTYLTEVKDVIFGESKANMPKCTIILTVISEYSGTKSADFQSTIGETIIDSFSLQPQAMFRINDYYKAATGERIPAKEYDVEEFQEMIKSSLIGVKLDVLTENDSSQGEDRTKVKKFSAVKTERSSASSAGGSKKLKR